ncbi:hypothetical protein PR048_016995 [Dryococelus australis]|uniref:deoxyribose-phosphate aldolase n=1 Tax=Dryococelus australis TaxID=614101 RepID=A0ABQ9H8H9_9NEOP|nr:hypothetical protein PR048_016995 [Dryococelus australis]
MQESSVSFEKSCEARVIIVLHVTRQRLGLRLRVLTRTRTSNFEGNTVVSVEASGRVEATPKTSYTNTANYPTRNNSEDNSLLSTLTAQLNVISAQLKEQKAELKADINAKFDYMTNQFGNLNAKFDRLDMCLSRCTQFDLGWVSSVRVNLGAVKRIAASLGTHRGLKQQWQAAWLVRAITCIDLTTLSGDDTPGNVARLCAKAAEPLSSDILAALEWEGPLTTGAVCVYPARVKDAVDQLAQLGAANIPVAAVVSAVRVVVVFVCTVATGFPSGQYPLDNRLAEIRAAVEAGAREIDVVVDRGLVLTHQWGLLYQQLQQMKEACGSNAHMKTILAVGECGSLCNVYKASLVAMMAGSDFIKTSTGKEAVNATLPVGIVMCRAIRDFHQRVGYKVGLKPAGGIRTAKDALSWLILVKEMLGTDWLTQDLFRIGASGLLTDIERQLYHYVTGHYACGGQFSVSRNFRIHPFSVFAVDTVYVAAKKNGHQTCSLSHLLGRSTRQKKNNNNNNNNNNFLQDLFEFIHFTYFTQQTQNSL